MRPALLGMSLAVDASEFEPVADVVWLAGRRRGGAPGLGARRTSRRRELRVRATLRAGRKFVLGVVCVFRSCLAVMDVTAKRALCVKKAAGGIVEVYRASLSLCDLNRHWSCVSMKGDVRKFVRGLIFSLRRLNGDLMSTDDVALSVAEASEARGFLHDEATLDYVLEIVRAALARGNTAQRMRRVHELPREGSVR